MSSTLIHGDCLKVLPSLREQVDAVVTDPPYGLEFMGKSWDKTGVAFQLETWELVAATMKPSSYLLAFGGTRTWHRLARALEDAGFQIRDTICWLYGSGFPKGKGGLKPAFEPIILARKPGTKVLPLGIEECRVDTNGEVIVTTGVPRQDYSGQNPRPWHNNPPPAIPNPRTGRWPANVVHDGSDEVLEAFAAFGERASRRERGEGNTHPTVKPLKLMEWLVKLACPPGGLVLDPFAGSGTTGMACIKTGRRFIGLEKDADYCRIAEKRIAHVAEPVAV